MLSENNLLESKSLWIKSESDKLTLILGKLNPSLNNRALAPAVQKLDSPIHRRNLYPVDNVIGFPNTYPLDSDLSGG